MMSIAVVFKIKTTNKRNIREYRHYAAFFFLLLLLLGQFRISLPVIFGPDDGRTMNVDTPTSTNNLPIQGPPVLVVLPHPHAGAKDSSGRWGYIHDPTVVRRRPHNFTVPPEERNEICAQPGQGPEGGNETYTFLTDTLSVVRPPASSSSGVDDVRLFCAVYTYPGGIRMTQAALETWAKRCDGFLAASYNTDASKGIVHIPHGGNHSSGYQGIWQKVRSMLTYIFKHYANDYDYFHINGDDTYLIVENLKTFLAANRPNFVGMWVPSLMNPKQLPDGFYYMGGGPGYTLSRSTLRLLVEDLLPTCYNDTDSSPEDFFVSHCLWKAGIHGEAEWDTRGAHRYHGFDPDFYRRFRWPKCARKNDTRSCRFWNRSQKRLNEYHNHHPYFTGGGIETFVSNESVSFHGIKTSAKMRRMEKLIYRRNIADDCA